MAAHLLKPGLGPEFAGPALRSALFHAGWLAQAQLGMSLTWGWFGGLGGVALWWALLSLLSVRRPTRSLSRLQLLALGGVAAGGVALAMSAPATSLRLLAWLAAAVAWALMCSQLQRTATPARAAACWPAWGLQGLGWLAGLALAVGLAADAQDWSRRWPLLCALLMVAALFRAEPRADCAWTHRLDLPTGLMMGSLLPMAQWCSAQGWSPASSIVLHMLAMGGGSAIAAWLHPPQSDVSGQGQDTKFQLAGAAWMTAALLCAWTSPWAMIAAAALTGAASRLAPLSAWGLRVPCGAALLLLVGQLGPGSGPDALRSVLAPALVLLALSVYVGAPRADLAHLARAK